jgi:hypothetical protein
MFVFLPTTARASGISTYFTHKTSLEISPPGVERSGSAAQKADQGILIWHKIAPAFCVSLNPVVMHFNCFYL